MKFKISVIILLFLCINGVSGSAFGFTKLVDKNLTTFRTLGSPPWGQLYVNSTYGVLTHGQLFGNTYNMGIASSGLGGSKSRSLSLTVKFPGTSATNLNHAFFGPAGVTSGAYQRIGLTLHKDMICLEYEPGSPLSSELAPEPGWQNVFNCVKNFRLARDTWYGVETVITKISSTRIKITGRVRNSLTGLVISETEISSAPIPSWYLTTDSVWIGHGFDTYEDQMIIKNLTSVNSFL